MPYEYLDHASEMGVLARGPTVEETFAEAARGLLGIQVDRGALVPTGAAEVRAEGRDLEECLVEYLNALIAAQDLEDLLFVDVSRPRLRREGEGFVLTGVARGVAREAAEAHRETEVKAVTYCGLAVEETDSGWLARFVVDV